MRKYELETSDKLIRILRKLFKRDKKRYELVLSKIDEVINSEDPNHYKNLSYNLKGFKRVHIDSHFVLIFSVDKSRRVIKFEDLQHHDKIYKRK